MVAYHFGRYANFMPPRVRPKVPARLYLAEWREDKGLTQQELADRLNTSDVTVSRWETGKRRPDMEAQEAIAEALGIRATDLRRHPSERSADALLRDQPPEIVKQALDYIEFFLRRR